MFKFFNSTKAYETHR